MNYSALLRTSLVKHNLITAHDADILSSENEIKELYHDAIQNGRAPGNTCKIQFLGDGRAGKTSLCKKLRGDRFDPEEKPTHGIVTKMCKVHEVDAVTWQDNTDDGSSELKTYLVSFMARILYYRETEHDHSASSTCKDVIVFIVALSTVFLSGILCVLIYLLFGYSWGFCINVNLVAVIQLMTKNTSVMRILSCIVYAPLMFQLSEFQTLWTNQGNHVDQIELSPLVSCFLVLQCLSIGLIYGFCCGCGVRTTIILAMLGCWTPSEPLQLHGIRQHFSSIFSMGLLVVLVLGIVIGFFLQASSPKLLFCSKPVGRDRCKQLREQLLLILIHVISIICVTYYHTFSTLAVIFVGLVFGIHLSVGVNQGRNMHAKVDNSVTCHILAVLLGWLLAYYYGFETVFNDLSIVGVLGIFSRIGLVCMVYLFERRNITECHAPVKDISEQLFEATAKGPNILKVPKKLSLWDFAGQHIYYNTHHAFMSAHGIYLLVFDLTRFIDPLTRSLEYQSIHNWLQSIYTHTNAAVLLVGTHFDQVTEQDIAATRHLLSAELSSFSVFDNFHLVPNGNSPFFKVDNSRNNEFDDTSKLRFALQKVADSTDSMRKEFPIKWKKFPIFVQEIRRKVQLQLIPERSLVMTVRDLQSTFQEYDFCELQQMLRFFNDAGEIIYDDVDCILRQFVIFDPQFIVDFMYFLTSPKSDCGSFAGLYAYWKILRSDGILHDVLVKDFLKTTDENFTRVVLTLLEAKDLICSIQNEMANDAVKRYIVPSMLPAVNRAVVKNLEWNHKFFIDFKQFHPKVILSRLMSRCVCYSNISFDNLGSSMHSDGGIFSLGDHFVFQLRLLNTCPTQHLIEVAVRAVADSNPLDLLRHVWNILETIRYRDFPKLRYLCGFLCPHPPPHHDSSDENMFHVIPLGSHKSLFTEEEKIVRLCFTRVIEYEPLRMPSGNSANYRHNKDSTVFPMNSNSVPVQATAYVQDGMQISSKSEPYDVFISCSSRDDGWVKENIIRVIGNLPHCLNICLNTYDSQTNPCMTVNARVIKETPVILVVCSKYYNTDQTGRLRYERELAYRYHSTLIPIVLPNGSIPDDMYDVEPIHFQSGLQDTESYNTLLQRIGSSNNT